MKPSNLFNTDDRAVSPVIGVILMVAITVILAAVIGTFVLGLGDSLGNSQPTAQLNVDTSADGNLTIQHNGGDSIDYADLELNADGSTVTLSEANDETGSTIGEGTLSVGDTVTVSYTTSGTVDRFQIIHTPSDSIIYTDEEGIDDFSSWT
jgi:flagellin-like protein